MGLVNMSSVTVSVLVPARNERLLCRTVEDLFNKAEGDIEVIVCLDGATEFPVPEPRRNLLIIEKQNPEGMRAAINSAAAVSMGKYLMKVDGHTAVSPGYDKVLQSACEDNWVVTARRYNLDIEKWDRNGGLIDYFYLSNPWSNPKYFLIQSCTWISRTQERMDIPIDDQMTMHGGMWFMTRRHWYKLGGMHEEGYGGFAGEPLEIGMKTWLGGGRMVVNKECWYAHPRDEKARYSVRQTGMIEGLIWGAKYWTENRWEYRLHDFDWLIQKFWPLPTESSHSMKEKYLWPDNYVD